MMKSSIKIVSMVMAVSGIFVLSNIQPAEAKLKIIDTEVSGVINQTGSVSDVGGNKNFSFVDEGAHYNTDIITAAKKDMANDWKWDIDTRVRKTDDNEVDTRSSVHLLQLTTRLMNKNSKFTFGDYYTRFTDLTLNRSLQGFNYQTAYPKVGTKINLVAAEQYRGLEGIRMSRYVWGYDLNQSLIANNGIIAKKELGFINDWKVGTTLVDTFDSSASIDNENGVPDLHNFLGSVYTNVRAIEDLNVNVELAKSVTGDHNDVILRGDVYGYAFRTRTDYRKQTKLGTTYLNFDYERIEPGYMALSGSAVPDREAYYGGVNQRFNEQLTFNAALRTLRDNLKKGPLPTTTRTVNPRFDLYITPFKDMRDFQVIPYYDYRQVHSSNSFIHNNTSLAGVEVRKTIWYELMVMGAYDLRKRFDDAGTSDETDNEFRFAVRRNFNFNDNVNIAPYFNFHFRNDRFDDIPNRVNFKNFNWGFSSEFYSRCRVYFTYGLNYDDRSFQNADTDYYAWDVTAEYDLTRKMMLVLGWREYNQHFQVQSNDFKENVGSIRLQYKY